MHSEARRLACVPLGVAQSSHRSDSAAAALAGLHHWQTVMLFLVFIPLVLCAGICLVPICLLRRPFYLRAQDYFVSSQPTSARCDTEFVHCLCLTDRGLWSIFRMGRKRRSLASNHQHGVLRTWTPAPIRLPWADARVSASRARPRRVHHSSRVCRAAARQRSPESFCWHRA
jgi:hypothetical protein